jgi:DNA-binding transcriptional LysR family regulator
MTMETRDRPRRALPLLESDLLRTFVAIADTGSLSRAAKQVHRTPGAVSMQVKRLEETLDRPLFVRGPRQVRLTQEGEALLGYGRRLLEINEEAVSQFLSPQVEGTVRFGVHDDVGRTLLPEVLGRFARTHPGVQVDAVAGRSVDMVRQLDAGELDLALIAAGDEGHEEGRGELVHTERLVWAGREGGTALARRPLPLALAAQGCAWRAMALSALDRAGVRYRIGYTSDHTSGQEAAMAADLAVSAFPDGLVKPPLIRLGEDSGLPPLGTYRIVMLRSEQGGPAADMLAAQVADRFAALSGSGGTAAA